MLEHLTKIERSYSNGDEVVFVVGNKIYVCFGGVDFHDHNKTIHFKDCNRVDETCIEANGEYFGDGVGDCVDVYLDNHLWENPNMVETRFYDDELIEIIAQ